MTVSNDTPIYVVMEAYREGKIEDVEIKNGEVVSYKLVGQGRCQVGLEEVG